MDFDKAVAAHSKWKMKLASNLRTNDRSMKPDEVQRDNLCDLGKWIQSESTKYAALAEFTTLKQAHGRFHMAAADVVRRANSGAAVSEEVALGAASEYAKASSAVVQAIMLMKQRVERG